MPNEESLRPMSDDDRQSLALLLLFCHEYSIPLTATGSRVIGGATNESDWDYVAYRSPWSSRIHNAMLSIGFELQGEVGQYGTRHTHCTYRKGMLNVIVTCTQTAFQDWMRATDLAKSVAPETKQQRIQIFDAVFGNRNRPMYILDDEVEGNHDF